MTVARFQSRQHRFQRRVIRRQLLRDQGAVIEEHQGNAIARAELVDGFPDLCQRIVPAGSVSHAEGAIQQHDAITGFGERSQHVRGPVDEGFCEGQAEKRDDQAAEYQQPPVANGSPAMLANGDVLEEHERGESEGRAFLAAHEMHEYRDRHGREACQKQRCEKSEAHRRTCMRCWRSVRYSNSAWSNRSEVSKKR